MMLAYSDPQVFHPSVLPQTYAMIPTRRPEPQTAHRKVSSKSPNAANGREKPANSLSECYKQIIREFEEKRPNNINIINIAKEYGIQHRRVYDLFNLLTSLGVCQNVERGKLTWLGISQITNVISKAYAKIEIGSLTKPTSQLFCLGPSPSLGSIATHFISMYLFFDVDTLLLRQVSTIFHDQRADIKSLERRMYLVLSFLEIMGIVAHTMKTNEYKLVIDLSASKEYALSQKKSFIQAKNPLSLENLLNTTKGPFEKDLKNERLRECPIMRC